MLVKFLNSDSTVSTAIAGSYFKGDGWTGAYYDFGTGQLVFESEDGLGFTTGDLRVATGGASSVEWTTVLNKPTSFPPSTHTHLWADITDKPTEFTPVSHNHAISSISGLQTELDGKQPVTSFKTVNGTAITGTGDITIPAGPQGDNITVTMFTNEAAFDAYTPTSTRDWAILNN